MNRETHTWHYMGLFELKGNKEGHGWLTHNGREVYFKKTKGGFPAVVGAPYAVEVTIDGESMTMHGSPQFTKGEYHELTDEWQAANQARSVEKRRKSVIKKAGVDNGYHRACEKLNALYHSLPPNMRSAILADMLTKITHYKP